MKKFSCFHLGNVDMVPHRLVFEGPTDVSKTETAEAPKEPDTRKYDERMVKANKKYLDVSQLQANVQRMDKMLGYFEMVQPLEEQKGG